MPLRCLTAGRMTMSATLLHRNDPNPNDEFGNDINLDEYGDWVDAQDPLTGEIVKIWEPHSETYVSYEDSFKVPGTNANPVTVQRNIPCIARGIVDGGIRVAGTTERYGDSYENIDYVKMWIPANVVVTKRDRITNIRDRSGRVRWLDEEYYDPTDPDSSLRATVFNVNGVTPLFDAFNNVAEWFVLLERATDV